MPARILCVMIGLAAVLAPTILPNRAAADIVFEFNYDFDTNNFFGAAGSAQRTALEAAGTMLGSRLGDSLLAITPGGANSWTAMPSNPSSSDPTDLLAIDNPTIAANTIRLYVGGSDLGAGTLGLGGPGGFSATTGFFDTILARGQSGALDVPATDFATWGGSISFNNTVTNWNFSLNDPSGSEVDFLSVALHEIGHVLGYGTSDSWDALVSGLLFTGLASTAANGGVNVPLHTDLGHWADGTLSPDTLLETAMDPNIADGQRKLFTTLDFAGLTDIGWQVQPAAVPEPSVLLLAGLGMGAVGWVQLRRRTASRKPAA